MSKHFITGLLFILPIVVFAQELPGSEEEIQAAYEKRIKKEYLYNVYIPKDLADCFMEFGKLISKESVAKFKSMSELDASRKLYFSFGRWISTNWGFYGGSRLSHYLKETGIHHPDDMAQFIIVSYHRYLHKKPLEVKEHVAYFQDRRKKEAEKRRKRGKVIESGTRKVPRPDGN